jgi:UDP-N-acetylmuramyl tripeptide synthase
MGAERPLHVDRRAAIGQDPRRRPPGDVVLIAGKGHENYQEIQGSGTTLTTWRRR